MIQTRDRQHPSPLAIGLALIHLGLPPIANASVNLARGTGPALFVGGWVGSGPAVAVRASGTGPVGDMPIERMVEGRSMAGAWTRCGR